MMLCFAIRMPYCKFLRPVAMHNPQRQFILAGNLIASGGPARAAAVGKLLRRWSTSEFHKL